MSKGSTGLKEGGRLGRRHCVDQCLCQKQPFALPAIMGAHYLHGWKARRERESENKQCTSRCSTALCRVWAVQHLLHSCGTPEIKSIGHILFQTCQVTLSFIYLFSRAYSWGLLEMYKLVMFTWIHKHYRNPISPSRSIPVVHCRARGLET